MKNQSSSDQDLYQMAHEKVASGEADRYLDKLNAIVEHPDNLKKIKETLIDLDSSIPMRHFRKYWDKLPHTAQWALMHLSKGSIVSLTGGPIHLLIKFGFINYKGHLNENGQIMEEKIQAMGGLDKYMLKYGVKIGKYFVPELAGVEPFVDPLIKLQNISDKTLNRVRGAVRAAREVREAPERNIEKISSSTRGGLQKLNLVQADPYDFDETPARATNDNRAAARPSKRRAA